MKMSGSSGAAKERLPEVFSPTFRRKVKWRRCVESVSGCKTFVKVRRFVCGGGDWLI